MSGLFATGEYQARWSGVLDEMAKCGHEAALILGRGGGSYDRCGDVLYLTNYYSCASGQEVDNPLNTARSFSLVLMQPGQEPELIIDEPDPRTDLLSVGRVSGHSDPMMAAGKALAARGINGPVALVGADFLPVKYWRLIDAAAPGTRWVEDETLVQRVRRIKSPAEHERCREAGEIATRALDLLMEGLVGGVSEAEAVAEAIREIRRSGGVCQMIPVAHGQHISRWATDPFTGAGTTIPQQGDLVRGWLDSIIFQGYWLDPGRTAVAGGKPSADQKALIENCVAIVDGVIDAIRPGANVHEVALLGDRLSKQFQVGDSQMNDQWPLYGHGTGLYWEHPYIGVKMSDPSDHFDAGMVLGIEAFLHIDGVGTAAHEQNLIVHADRNEIITHSPIYWW
ncbi:MAG: aminopeptidase P family protein [Rhodospirillaceae bacterium]|nr:aminopeptidase P family protein [Rhodospirillaceae bacterium]